MRMNSFRKNCHKMQRQLNWKYLFKNIIYSVSNILFTKQCFIGQFVYMERYKRALIGHAHKNLAVQF